MPERPDPVEFLHRIVATYSPTGHECEVAKLILEAMHSLGINSKIDEVGNVIGKAGDSGPTFLLCGHMDTIPGMLPVKIEGGKLYGRGAVDAKAAMAAFVFATGLLLEEGFKARIIVVGAVDEEGKGRGIKHLIKKGIKADYAIFGEPSGVDNITIAYKGSLHVKLTCTTRTGHSSSPWLFSNAVEEAFALWRELQRIRLPEEKPESRFYSVTSALTEIRGGSRSSIIPSTCMLRLDFRLPPGVKPSRLMEEVERAVELFKSARPGVGVEVNVEDSCDPYEADKDSVLVRGLSWAVRKVREKPATLLRKTGTGDMNLLGNILSIPTVTYGPGDSRLDHTEDEHIDVNDYLDSIKILKIGLEKAFELHNRRRERLNT
jgi:LysW-gamma-L-lysine carboxypeptidase